MEIRGHVLFALLLLSGVAAVETAPEISTGAIPSTNEPSDPTANIAAVAATAHAESDNNDDVNLFVSADSERVDRENEAMPDAASSSSALQLPTGQPPKKKRTRHDRRWTRVGGDDTKDFVFKSRSKVDAGGSVASDFFSKGYKIEPDNPAYSNVGPHFSTKGFAVPTVGFWVPDVIWPSVCPRLPCPHCGKDISVKRKKWAGVPRYVLGMKKNWVLDTCWYHCGSCDKNFRGTHPDSVALMPDNVRANFNVILGPKYAADTDLSTYTLEHFSTVGTAGMVSRINRWHAEEYWATVLVYWATHSTLKSAGIKLCPRPGKIDTHFPKKREPPEDLAKSLDDLNPKKKAKHGESSSGDVHFAFEYVFSFFSFEKSRNPRKSI